MPISRDPLVEVIRVWDGLVGASARLGVVVVTYEYRDVVVLSAASGPLSRADMREMGADLLAAGVRVVRAWRANGHRMPGARLVEVGRRHSLWEMDLPAFMARVARSPAARGH
ncbi:hypothetical protein CJ010_00725 [Azoarcus sp. DD4]|nr:hypothetical protein CJ010_00725 [Azoarcus sp. DD4]